MVLLCNDKGFSLTLDANKFGRNYTRKFLIGSYCGTHIQIYFEHVLNTTENFGELNSYI